MASLFFHKYAARLPGRGLSNMTTKEMGCGKRCCKSFSRKELRRATPRPRKSLHPNDLRYLFAAGQRLGLASSHSVLLQLIQPRFTMADASRSDTRRIVLSFCTHFIFIPHRFGLRSSRPSTVLQYDPARLEQNFRPQTG